MRWKVMKISEYMQGLQTILDEHGDLEVQHYSFGRRTANPPKVGHERILRGRESTPQFAYPYDDESRKGEKVCHI